LSWVAEIGESLTLDFSFCEKRRFEALLEPLSRDAGLLGDARLATGSVSSATDGG
jgi:hypothetical protein